METLQIDKDLCKKLDEQEIRYWSDYYLYSSASVRDKLGIWSNIFAGAFCGTLSKIDTLFLNRVLGLGINNKIENELIADIINFFGEAGTPRFFIHASPAAIQDNVADLLFENGFIHHNNWAKLFKYLDAGLPEKSSGIHSEEIILMDSGVYEEIIEAAFELEGDSCMFFSQTIGKPGWKHYTANLDGRPIAAAAMYCYGGIASLAMAGTLPDYRGLGAQGALVTRRLNDALDIGCKIAVVETAEDTPGKPSPSYRNMLKYGFEPAYHRANYVYNF